jgi:hypothetical protein
MSDQTVCSNCKQGYDSTLVICPHCGQAQWGTIVTIHIFWLICAAIFFWLVPRLPAGFFRTILQLGSGGVGLICLLVGLYYTIKALQTQKQPFIAQRPTNQPAIKASPAVPPAAASTPERLPQAVPSPVVQPSPAPRPEKVEAKSPAIDIPGLQAAHDIPGLIAALQQPDGSVRRAAAAALGLVGDERALAALSAALEDPYSYDPAELFGNNQAWQEMGSEELVYPVRRAASLALESIRARSVPD